MNSIYIVCGSVDDKITFTLGIYDSFELAKHETVDFIENLSSVYSIFNNDTSYYFSAKRMDFKITIHKIKINETTIPEI